MHGGRPKNQRLIVSLQYLRGVAAMMVVFCHGWDQLPWFKEWMPNIAQSGVDLFFVISGFIMVFVTASAGSSAWGFLKMRIIRIVPLYWLYNFATAALILTLPQLFQTSVFTVPHFLQSLFFIPHFSPSVPPSLSPLILLGWTLNYEMFFYVVFTVAMAVSVTRRVPLTMVALVILPVLGLFSVLEGSAPGEFYSNDIILEFVFGMMLATLFLNGVADGVGVLGGAILMAIGAIGLCVGGCHPELPRALVFGVPAALIVAGALSIEAARTVPKRQPFLLLGDASYSIYLAHLFPLAVLRFGWNRLGLPTEGIVPVFTFMTIALAGGALAGVASYLLLERPMLQFMRRPRRTELPIPLASGIPAGSNFAK
jgi:exopolysaccharide production protein ExoZ